MDERSLMTKGEYVKNICDATGFTKKVVQEVLEAQERVTVEALMNKKDVRLMNGLTIAGVWRESRNGRNPATGEIVTIPAKYVPKAKFGKAFKEIFS